GLGRETLLVGWYSGIGATIGIVDPRPRQEQGAVNQRVPARGGIGQIHRNLGVLDTPSGAGVLALHPDRMNALVHIPGFVNHEDGPGVTERVDDILTQIISNPVGVPLRPRQQVLQPVGAGVATGFGDRPAILAVQPRNHPEHQLTGMAQGFITGKSRRDPVDHRRELGPPPIRVYAMSRGDRGIFRCVHKLRTMPRSPPLPAQTRQKTRIPNYGCSTRRLRISLFSRSWGLFDQIWRQICLGKAVNARSSARASSRWVATFGSLSASASMIRSY